MTILRELLVAFFVGGMPMIIYYFISGSDAMIKLLGRLTPKDEIIWYLFTLLIIHIGIYLFDHFLPKINQRLANISQKLRSLSYDVGFSLLGIFRAITGALPTAMAILVSQEGLEGALPVTVLSMILFVGSLFACLILTWLQRQTKLRPKFLE